MTRLVLVCLSLTMLLFTGPSQAADIDDITARLEQMWTDMAKGEMDPAGFDPDQNLTAYSSGGLWEDHTGEELSKALVGGGTTLDVSPYHIKIRLLGENSDVAHATYYLAGRILAGTEEVVTNYRTRISQVLEKQEGKWVVVANHASPLFGGSGVTFE